MAVNQIFNFKTVFTNKFFLAFVLVLAFGLRIAGLSFFPPALNWDEVSHGYNAYSILKTGKDEWGQTLPTIFRAYGDYKLPVYVYITAISEAIFGLNEFAVRLPSVIAGTGTVLFIYLFTKKLTSNRQTALLAALIAAIAPWDLFLSRIALEANLGLFLTLTASYFFLENKLVHSVILFGLSVWTYNSARFFAPTFLITLFLVYRKRINLKVLLVAGIFFVPMTFQLFNQSGNARYDNLKIIDEGAIAKIEEQRNTSQLPTLVKRIAYNKYIFFGKEFAKNYISYFSPQFLFLTGGSHYQFSIPNHGILYLVDLPFLLIGIGYGLKESIKNKNREIIILFLWLILAAVPGSVTRDAPHVLRFLIAFPVFVIFISIGVVKIFEWLRLKKKNLFYIAVAAYLLIYGVSFENYFFTAVTKYRTEYSWAWQYGYKEAVSFVSDNYTKYDKIIMTKKYGEPHEFLLFYAKWDPMKYQIDPNLNRFYQSKWYWVDGFDKFYFVNDWQIPQKGDQFVTENKTAINCKAINCLLITSPGNFPKSWRKIQTINFLDGKPVFELYEN